MTGLMKSSRGAVLLVPIVCFLLVGRTSASGITNGNFQTGDLTGWNANTLIPPNSTPATVNVITVGGSLVGNVSFSNSVGGHYAGSLSQDFFTGGATKLTFDFGFAELALVTPGEPNVVDSLDIIVQNLDTNTTISHNLHTQNQPGEPTGAGLDSHTNGLPFHAFATLSGSNTHVRIELMVDFHTLDGATSSGQLMIDNLTLVPEPSTCVLAMGGVIALGTVAWRQRGRPPR